MNASAAPAARTFAVGDIHGCAVALEGLANAIRPGRDDTFVVLGDVIDYGPDTRGAIEILLDLRNRTNLVLLIGNHEEMLFGVLDGRKPLESWLDHGGDRTLASYGAVHPRELPEVHIDFLRSARPWFETADFAFVHAGYFPNLPLPETPGTALFWEPFAPSRAVPHYSGKTFVVGHTPQTTGEILDLGFLVVIDTDCSRGNRLTALEIGGRYFQADPRGNVRERFRASRP